jgi:hypothetical protein
MHVSANLSHHWHWFANGNIESLMIIPGAADTVEISNVRLLSASTTGPRLTVKEPENAAGIVQLRQPNFSCFTSAQDTPGAVAIALELGKPNCFFDNFGQSDTGDASDMVAETKRLQGKQGSFCVSGAEFAKTFPNKSFYQLRARCIDGSGKAVGGFSDPVTIQVIR